ncbi:hypothetical protein, partial [Acinetobacter baumannii]
MSYFDINRSGELAIFIRVVELGLEHIHHLLQSNS